MAAPPPPGMVPGMPQNFVPGMPPPFPMPGGRPPLIPVPPPMMMGMPGLPLQLQPSLIPGAMATMMAPAMQVQAKPVSISEMKGATTVFVGNITDKATDTLMKQILLKCGPIVNWKRVQDATGKLQAFGFCEYADPECTLRAMRLLNELELGDKCLKVKVDRQNKKELLKYLAKKKLLKQDKPVTDEEVDKLLDESDSGGEALLNELDDEMKQEDQNVMVAVNGLVKENIVVLSSSKSSDDARLERDVQHSLLQMAIQSGKMDEDSTLDDVNMEEDIKTLVSDEIKKFRKSYQNYEEEKAKHRAQRDKERLERVIRTEKDKSAAKSTSGRERSRSPHEESKLTEEEREKKRLQRLAKEEEEYEQRELDRRKRAREDAYRERLRAWETRERRKARQYKYDREKEVERKEEMESESWNLSKFLEDYDDTKQDNKYYRGSGFSRRRREREVEVERDERDRQREKEELEALRLELMERQVREREASKRGPKAGEGDEEDELPVKTDIDVNIPLTKNEYESPFPPIKVQAAPSVDTPDGRSPSSEEEKPTPHPPKLTFGIGKKPSTPTVSTPTSSSNGALQTSSMEQMFGNVEETVVEPKPKKKFSLMNTEAGGQLMARLAYAPPGTDMSHEERKKLIQSLVSSLPTGKEELFGWDLKWNNIDQGMIDKKIIPWINKKMVEYIGGTEPMLTDFICKKLMEHTQPEEILKDIKVVLEEEADVFVKKLWRLLIYETEARHLGIAKSYS